MYFPNWLIIALICGVLLFYYNKKRERHPYNQYFKRKWLPKRKIRYYQNNNSPDDRITSDYYDYLTEKCYKKIFYSSNINKRFPAEEELVDDINLCDRLFTFVEDIRYFSHWNEEQARKDSGVIFTSWYSEEIGQSVRTIKCSDSKVIGLFSKQFQFNDTDEILEYEFATGGKNYILIRCPPQLEFYKYYPLIIMESNGDLPKVVLITKLYYQKKFDNEFLHYKLEEFRNDDWLEFLLDKMFKVRIEEKKFRELRDLCEKDHKDDPNGYWYEEPWEKYKDKKTFTDMCYTQK